MRQSILWRITVSLCVLAVAGVFLFPALKNFNEPVHFEQEKAAGAASFLPDARINLGLDLKGGIQLTLGVEVDKAIQTSLSQIGDDILSDANKEGIFMTRPRVILDDRLEFTLASPDKKAAIEEVLARFTQLNIFSQQPQADGKVRYVLELTPEARVAMADMTVEQAVTTIRNRIDQFGVAEPDIRREQGENRVSIQLPGLDDPERAVEVIGKTAHLEFRLVREGVSPSSRVLPAGVELLPMEDRDAGSTGESSERFIVVEKQVALTGEHITNAVPRYSNEGAAYVALSFDRRGTDIFSKITRENIGKRLAIVLDGKVHSAPVIQSEINGEASITGSFTPAQASDLSLVLRAGSLPAPVTVLEEQTVGPSLGKESIEQGVMAAMVSGIAIMAFMLVYYGVSGLIANIMLLLDIGLILAGMSMFGATLTLPGIAGIVLTLGMAVDANVLVFERIREETRKGLTPLAAIDAGFSRAMLAIVDSNLTTIMAAVILYQFGTGPIRGFAVTLTMGVLASMFTAIFISRIIFDIWMSKPGRKLRI